MNERTKRRERGMPPVDALDKLLANLHDNGPSRIGSSVASLIGARLNCRSCDVKPFPEADTHTNPKFVFLRELDGPPEVCLPLFLKKVRDEITAAQADMPFGTHSCGMLIVDRPVTLTEPIEIPQLFTLAGVGMSGAGSITFKGNFTGPAITFQENSPGSLKFGGQSMIRDIAIIGPGGQNAMAGIKAGSEQFVNNLPDPDETQKRALGKFQLHRVRVTGFGDYGVQGGMNTYQTYLHDCELIDNRVHIQMIFQCNGWRIRDCIFSGATAWAIDAGAEIVVENVLRPGTLDDLLIEGCRFERNSPGAIIIRPGHNMGSPKDPNNPNDVDTLNHPRVDTTSGVKVFGSHFRENNGVAVKVEEALVQESLDNQNVIAVSPLSGARILCNFFGDGEGVILPADEQVVVLNPFTPTQLDLHPLLTQIGFNATRAKDSKEVLNRLRARRSAGP